MKLGLQEVLIILGCVGLPFIAIAVVLLLVMSNRSGGGPKQPPAQ
jgi:hypothetical protein